MYFKRWIGSAYFQKSDIPHWVKWVHVFQGEAHCLECLALDGCLFSKDKTPPWPHHPNCHCVLVPVDEAVVRIIVSAHSDYSKFDPYLFNTQGRYSHGKEKLFAQWGYTIEDAKWLQVEMERQAMEKYCDGKYELGKLNIFGQRINTTTNDGKFANFLVANML